MRQKTKQSIELGKILSSRRKELGLKQNDIAQLTGISKTTIGRYERGESQTIPDDFIFKLNEALDLNIPLFSDQYNLIGKRYGALTVIEFAGIKGRKHRYWRCRCDCGIEIIARGSHLYNGNVKSCGCRRTIANKEKASQNGLSRSPLYNVWRGMLKRCYLNTTNGYKNYGGRGMSVCDDWKNDFQSFYRWAVSSGYEPGKSIDRIDVDANYCPENCRWADAKQQANNRTNTTVIMFCNESHTAAEWAEITGIPRETIKSRLRKGIPVGQALSARNMRTEGR